MNKKIYLSDIEGSNRRDRPLSGWEDRVNKYLSERGTGKGGGEGLNKQVSNV